MVRLRWSKGVPLIQCLSSGQFIRILDDLDILANAEHDRGPDAGQATEARLCKCDCGGRVAEGRKFVNQDHYSVWLSRERYFGKNRK
jgi:hypothetical protein